MMMKLIKLIIITVIITWISPVLKAQSEDIESCRDHPLFNRMPGYKIKECAIKESDTVSFPLGKNFSDDSAKQTIVGKSYFYSYSLPENAQKTHPLLIFRNFEDSLRHNYGYVAARVIELGNSNSFITGKIEKENMIIWALIQASGSDYKLTIVEKHRKVNIIMADEIWNTLEKTDTITLDIFFEEDTTIIIPASLPIIDQLYEMLVSHPDLQISIRSHTDNNLPPVNRKVLTAIRAKAVQDALTEKGIEKARLKSSGWGSDKPVADNSTEEGRAKNRRIIIVKN